MYKKTDIAAEQLDDANARLAVIAKQPTNAELLAWARAHYPQMDYAAEIAGAHRGCRPEHGDP